MKTAQNKLYNKRQNKPIILVGMPGSGKSTIGRALASILSLEFIDIDEIIEKSENKKITEIFSQNGEDYFRQLETNAIKSLPDTPCVVSTGGGIVKNLYNMELLKNKGLVFYLKISPAKIFDRIKDDKTRPLLLKADPLEELEKLYLQRKNNYEPAHFAINADDTEENITNKVIEIYENSQCSN